MQGNARLVGWTLVLSWLTACSGGQPASGATTAPGATIDGRASAPSHPAAAGGLVLDGQHFTVRTVRDPQLQNMPVFLFVAPATWRDQSAVKWNFANVSNPVVNWTKVENPGTAEAFYLYPGLSLFWLDHGNGLREGQESLGMTFTRVMPPTATIAAFARQLRGREPGFDIVGSQQLPGLAAALRMPHDGTQRQGVGLKVRYSFDGKPVEEEFYGLYYKVNVPYDGPQGRTWQTDWGLQMLHSFRAPAGTLDQRREIFTAIPKSIRRNPAWTARYNGITRSLGEQFNRQLQAGYDQIAAAGRLSRQLTANSDAFLASVDSSLQASRGGGSGGGGAGVDKFDDYIRGVETTDDPYYGTSQHSTMESYHWTDGYGGYRNTNDPGSNPNTTENGTWTLMQPSR